MSRYFSVDEFRCHSGEAYPAAWVDDRLSRLCSVLDAIRDAWEAPLHIVSGYRSPAFNAALAASSAARNGVSGVAQNSQHVQGRAADIRPLAPSVERVSQLHAMVRRLYEEGKIPPLGGLGLYPGWIHVDVRAGDHLATWGGVGAGESP